jgi:hypothetical protein
MQVYNEAEAEAGSDGSEPPEANEALVFTYYLVPQKTMAYKPIARLTKPPTPKTPLKTQYVTLHCYPF